MAVSVMAEQGVAGLSVGEVARRMGMRPPSLYVYFASKHALYDTIFARGWTELERVMEAPHGEPATELELPAYLLARGSAFVRWGVEHPAYAQLMFWRPVPGYTPSAEAYAPAVAVYEQALAAVTALQSRGLLRHDVEPAAALRTWTILTSGVFSQQLANAPHEPFDSGTFTSMLPQLVEMFLAGYGPSGPGGPTRRRPDADER